MQSYASPGRVITIVNSGPGAVEVVRDQPYRLGALIGVTQHGAAVDADLNLCVEGMYDQMVDLAAGVDAVEAGSPVHMATDGTWALVAGLTDATGYVPFGIVTERMTRRRGAQVKLMPIAATAPASGGGGDGGGSSAANALVLSGFSLGPAYTPDMAQYLYATSTVDGVGARPLHVVAPSPDFMFPCARYPGGEATQDYIGVVERCIVEVSVQLSFISNVDDFGVLVNAYVYDANGTFVDSLANLTVRNGAIPQPGGVVAARDSSEAFYTRVGKNSGFLGMTATRTFALDAGWKIALQIDGTGPAGGNDGTSIVIFNGTDPQNDGDPNAWYFSARTGVTLRRVA